MNIFKLFYSATVRLLSTLHVHEGRTDKYLGMLMLYTTGADRVLDVGSGPGTFSSALACEKRLVVAMDLEYKFLSRIENTHVQRICADAHHLPFSDNSFDCVICISLFEHLKNPEKGARELYRVLRYGGIAVIQVPNLRYPFEPHTNLPLLYLLPKTVQSRIFKILDYAYVNMEVTIKRCFMMFRDIGLSVKKMVKVYHLPIMKLLPFAPAYIFIVRKEYEHRLAQGAQSCNKK